MLGAVSVLGAKMQRNVIQRVVIGERAVVELNLMTKKKRFGVLTVVRIRVDLDRNTASSVLNEAGNLFGVFLISFHDF